MNAATTGALLAVIAVAMAATAHPAAHAVHADDPTVRTPEGNAVPGCQEDDTCFIPSTIEVGPGTTVTWENNDIVPHTVTSGAAGSPTGEFDSGLTDGGTTFEHTFEEVGEYPYFCLVHPWMVGTVFVTEAHSHPEPGERRTDIPDISEGSMLALPGGEIMVGVVALGDPAAGEPLELALAFTDADGEVTEHLNFDVVVRQGGAVVLEADDVHAHQTEGPEVVTTAALASDEPVDVEVTFQGFGLPGTPIGTRTGPTGEMVEFEQVPEFGAVAVMVLVAAVISIVAITSRSGILQRA